MRKMLLATATALTMAAVPAAAQVNSVEDKRDMSAEQQAIYDAFTPEQRVVFDTYSPEYQTVYYSWDPMLRDYYWTITPEEQLAFYSLTPEERYALSYGTSGMTYQSTPVVQTLAATSHSGEYPVCTGDNDDHCINAWAAGKRGPGVDRPLGYWPGESMTEMRTGG